MKHKLKRSWIERISIKIRWWDSRLCAEREYLEKVAEEHFKQYPF